MPSHKSYKKSILKNEIRMKRNKAHKTRVKNIFKAVENAETAEQKTELINQGYQIIDRACAYHIMKKNKASRKKSQLAKLLS